MTNESQQTAAAATTTAPTCERQRRTGTHRRLPRSFSLDERVVAELEHRAQGENLSRVCENLLCQAMGVAHPEARAAAAAGAGSAIPMETPTAE